MEALLFPQFELHPATWVYISSIALVGFFFKFNRLMSVRNLDLVVTCDTSIAHVAGALGVPVWLALAWWSIFSWRWLRQREDCPWYPSMRLFRQKEQGNWPELFARMADALDPQTRTLKVFVELPNPGGRFRPEMFGTVRHSGVAKHLLVVPAGAIVQEYGRNTIFLERAPGQYERRPVVVGPPVREQVPVLSGLQQGDRIVVDGAVLLKDR